MNNVVNYQGACFVMTTLHRKGQAIAPIFAKELGVLVVECALDTDSLGSFSGEVVRKDSFIETARIKCELGLRHTNADYGLASEGSFGPHPSFPFGMVNIELIYFVDRVRNFQFYMTHLSHQHNYGSLVTASFADLKSFAKKSLFPTHGLIIKPHISHDRALIFKGIQLEDDLQKAFEVCMQHSSDGAVLVETDMRAHMNPSRMLVIQELAENFTKRLASSCPSCLTPGWGLYGMGKKINCSWCDHETILYETEIFGCVKCDYQEEKKKVHESVYDLREYCTNCNP